MTTVLITGSNRGIGLELARIYLGRGATVHAVVRRASPELEALAREGRLIVHAGVDMRDPASIERLGGALDGVTLDVVVCNAGILRRDRLDALDLASIREQWDVNALAPLATVAALRSSLGAGSKVALVTSRMGSIGDNGSGGSYGYRMSKAALNAAGVSLARDLAPRGVAVVLLHPGFVRTEMTGGNGDVDAPAAAARLVDRIDALDVATTGRFLHANGSELPW